MCQHCNHAPCETVCPVAASSHGRQGQNHMAYNRCVGTRYCANNCPYKVRRFNWFLYNKNDEFDYHMNDDLGRMVLNPDVVVRSRGVMEKCSMCIQMTQKTILDAKLEGREIKDGEFQTACSSACGTGALAFGDSDGVEWDFQAGLVDEEFFASGPPDVDFPPPDWMLEPEGFADMAEESFPVARLPFLDEDSADNKQHADEPTAATPTATIVGIARGQAREAPAPLRTASIARFWHSMKAGSRDSTPLWILKTKWYVPAAAPSTSFPVKAPRSSGKPRFSSHMGSYQLKGT